MSTNFYWNGNPDNPALEDLQAHIGKRSGAGAYCCDCGIVLADIDSAKVHRMGARQLDYCPSCGQSRNDCVTVCSFTWSMLRHRTDLEALRGYDAPVVIDEYDRTYTADEFLDVILANVPFTLHFQLACTFS